MPINIQQYSENEAWLLFKLNEEPIPAKSDDDFNVFSIMEVATGLILGTAFLSALADGPSEFDLRGLLSTSESKAGVLPRYLFMDADLYSGQIADVETLRGMKVIPEERENLDPITKEARDGFAAHFGGGTKQ